MPANTKHKPLGYIPYIGFVGVHGGAINSGVTKSDPLALALNLIAPQPHTKPTGKSPTLPSPFKPFYLAKD